MGWWLIRNELFPMKACVLMFVALGVACSVFGKQMNAAEYFLSEKQRALAEAAANGQIIAIDKSLADGSKLNFQGKEGMTALVWALLKPNKAGFEHLLERGANPNLPMTADAFGPHGIFAGASAMSLAAMSEDPWFLEMCLKHGGDPNLLNPDAGTTPIFECINLLDSTRPVDRLRQLRLLITAGARLNVRNKYMFTPMMVAAMMRRYDMVYIMLEAGADPMLPDKVGATLADYVQRNKVDPGNQLYGWRVKVIDLLKAKGSM